VPKRPPTINRDELVPKHPAPAAGVPVYAPVPEDFTPVTAILEIADRVQDAETRELVRDIAAQIWQHTANMRMRTDAQYANSDAAEVEALRVQVTELERRVVDISGKDGTNGKLGENRRRTDALSRAAWWLVCSIVGGIGAAAIKLVMVVRAFDAVEARSLHNAQQLLETTGRVLRLETEALRRSHRFSPADAPDRKDTP
jgi:hypothetical protein